MSYSAYPIAVVMERHRLVSRWQSQSWRAVEVLPDPGDSPAMQPLVEEEARAQWLYRGFVLKLYRDEAENYYLNISAPDPCVFVIWRVEDDRAVPKFVTVSYGEAARFMDANEQVDSVPMPQDLRTWVGAFVEAHYSPEPKTRIRPPSFLGAKRG